jgi:hypothetical protein
MKTLVIQHFCDEWSLYMSIAKELANGVNIWVTAQRKP